MLALFFEPWRARQFGLTVSEYRRFRTLSLFDPRFYLATQPDIAAANVEPEKHYCNFGWREGRNPSEKFNTIWYLQTYEDAARSGLNPLVHYVRFGIRDGRATAPSDLSATDWLDEAETNPILPERMREFLRSYNVVRRSGLFQSDYYCKQYLVEQGDPIEHYLRYGGGQGYDPNPFFKTAWYVQTYADVSRSGVNPFVHYLQHGRTEGRLIGQQADEAIEPTGLRAGERAVAPACLVGPTGTKSVSAADLAGLAQEFDEPFYRKNNPELDFSSISPVEHYASFGWREGRDPSPEFSTKGYLYLNRDVHKAGMNPLLHYVLRGKSEGRRSRLRLTASRPANGISEWKGYDEVWQRGLESLEGQGRDVSALAFCVALGGLDLAEVLARIDFGSPEADNILVSIVIPCLDEELVTVECLQSIERALPTSFDAEVIVADNASEDAAYTAISQHPTIRYIRFEKNIGFGPACNAAASKARGNYLFFLNNDAQIAPGCLEALVAAAAEPGVGIVGPKILSFDGSLQEAGCLLNRDGTGALIGFGRDPRTPRYNYARRVEHASGAAILIDRELFLGLGGFDDAFAPAYCEDADLSLKVREKGLSIVYEPRAVVAHHLSKTASVSSVGQSKRQRISRNRQTLVSRWADRLVANDLRTIAFYLPQYHPIPENDLWWGKGFTEWTNVARAQPNYVGHNQPRFPSDLGYYDLRVPEVMEEQADLARRYGVTGFCYYYYWFDGKRLLDHPLERMLATGKPDLPFCLCWANENWTRRWDGREDDVLLGQSYSDERALEIAKDFVRYFRTDAYVRINGKPLILIYRIKDLPNPRRATTVWRNYCRQSGIGEICIAMVESFDLSARPEDPSQYGCDITVEFPAHGMVHDEKMEVEKLNFDWTGAVHDYRELAAAFMRRVEGGFTRLRSVLVGWDNTPRRPDRGLILEHATPGAFQAWLEWTYRRTMEQNFGQERIVFINAWNEWCEGSYLEPDRRFGHGYLQAVRNALDAIESGGGAFVL